MEFYAAPEKLGTMTFAGKMAETGNYVKQNKSGSDEQRLHDFS